MIFFVFHWYAMDINRIVDQLYYSITPKNYNAW